MRKISVRIFFHELLHKSDLLGYVECEAFVSSTRIPAFSFLAPTVLSPVLVYPVFNFFPTQFVQVSYSLIQLANLPISPLEKISSSTMCSAIVLMSLLFPIDLRTSSSNFSPISISSLFLNFCSFSMEGSSRNLFMSSISIIGSS